MNIIKRLATGAVLLAGTWSAAGQEIIEYIHTDALGSPVAVSDAAGNVIERTVYEPYGATVRAGPSDAPGFTGHVADSATGLTYMQQRYYDAEIGAFLSVDAVAAYSGSSANFNRYRYGNGNPLKFLDPDGNDAIYFTDASVVVIPVHFSGSGATRESVGEIKRRVDSLKSEFSGLRIVLQPLQAPGGIGTNVMRLEEGRDYKSYPRAGEGVDSFGGNKGYIDTGGLNWRGAAVHDILHFAGAPEGYADSGSREGRTSTYRPGYSQKHIMADRSGNSLRAMDEDAIKGNSTTFRHQLGSFQGVFRVSGRIESKQLEKKLGGK